MRKLNLDESFKKLDQKLEQRNSARGSGGGSPAAAPAAVGTSPGPSPRIRSLSLATTTSETLDTDADRARRLSSLSSMNNLGTTWSKKTSLFSQGSLDIEAPPGGGGGGGAFTGAKSTGTLARRQRRQTISVVPREEMAQLLAREARDAPDLTLPLSSLPSSSSSASMGPSTGSSMGSLSGSSMGPSMGTSMGSSMGSSPAGVQLTARGGGDALFLAHPERCGALWRWDGDLREWCEFHFSLSEGSLLRSPARGGAALERTRAAQCEFDGCRDPSGVGSPLCFAATSLKKGMEYFVLKAPNETEYFGWLVALRNAQLLGGAVEAAATARGGGAQTVRLETRARRPGLELEVEIDDRGVFREADGFWLFKRSKKKGFGRSRWLEARVWLDARAGRFGVEAAARAKSAARAEVDVLLCQPRVAAARLGRDYVFELVHVQQTVTLACDSAARMMRWIKLLQDAQQSKMVEKIAYYDVDCVPGSSPAAGAHASANAGAGAGDEFAELAKALLRLPQNARCADCGGREPIWAVVNFGVFVCIRCSGVHRSLGTHISQVRSVTMDRWDAGKLEKLQTVGNAKGNAELERSIAAPYYKISPDCGDVERSEFIQAKYEMKRFS